MEIDEPKRMSKQPSIIKDMKKILADLGIEEYEDTVPFILAEYYEKFLSDMLTNAAYHMELTGRNEINNEDIQRAASSYFRMSVFQTQARQIADLADNINCVKKEKKYDRFSSSAAWNDNKSIECVAPSDEISLQAVNYQIGMPMVQK